MRAGILDPSQSSVGRLPRRRKCYRVVHILDLVRGYGVPCYTTGRLSSEVRDRRHLLCTTAAVLEPLVCISATRRRLNPLDVGITAMHWVPRARFNRVKATKALPPNVQLLLNTRSPLQNGLQHLSFVAQSWRANSSSYDHDAPYSVPPILKHLDCKGSCFKWQREWIWGYRAKKEAKDKTYLLSPLV